jgi:hypothetical protein
VQAADADVSEWLAVPRSVKTTCVKPSGTVSLLAGASPGMHFPESRFYLRRVRLGRDHALYDDVESILVYPNAVVPPERPQGFFAHAPASFAGSCTHDSVATSSTGGKRVYGSGPELLIA